MYFFFVNCNSDIKLHICDALSIFSAHLAKGAKADISFAKNIWNLTYKCQLNIIIHFG